MKTRIKYISTKPSSEAERLLRVGKAIQELQDGYTTNIDGYNCDNQINVRLTIEDIKEIHSINKIFFEGELSNSMIGRVLIRKGIQWYKNLSK